MKSKVIVNIVNEAPAIGKPQMLSGIRDRQEAENWAMKNGYSVVWLWQSRQRVYADKRTKLTGAAQTKSDHLVQVAEV